MSSIRNFFNLFTKSVDRHFLTSVDLEFLNNVKKFDAQINNILEEMKMLTNDKWFPQDPSFTYDYIFQLQKLEKLVGKQTKDIWSLMEKKVTAQSLRK